MRAELFEHDRRLDDSQAHPALGFGNHQPEHPEFGQGRPDLWVDRTPFALRNEVERNPIAAQARHGLLQLDLRFIQSKLHSGPSPSPRIHRDAFTIGGCKPL